MRPYDDIPQKCPGLDPAFRTDPTGTGDIYSFGYYCRIGDGRRPIGRRQDQVTWAPTRTRDGPVNSQIFRARADVEPLLLVQNDTADAVTVSDRFSQDGNKGNFAAGRNLSNHFWIPNRNV